MSEHVLDWSETAVPRYADAAIQATIARCLHGDEAAYGLLYDQFASTIYRLTYNMLQHKEDAEEVLQDSFEYAFRKLDQYDPHKSAFKTWLYRIAISRCRNKRRRKWLPSVSLSQLINQEISDDQSPTPDEVLALGDEQQRVWQALAELTPKLRETAVLRYYEGLTYNEIGSILGIPAKTAESRMRLAHKALRDLLKPEEEVIGKQ
jgi:RNA polymerase sigma-70 factor (ECF subfamily)